MHLLVLRLKKYGAFDACLLVAALALFAVNEHLVKPVALGAVLADGMFAGNEALAAGFSFMKAVVLGHLNDFLGGIAFLAYTNLLIALVQPRYRIRRFYVAMIFIFCCGLFWEYAAPLFVPDSVSDLWDVLAYCLGGAAYWAITKMWGAVWRRKKSTPGESLGESD